MPLLLPLRRTMSTVFLPMIVLDSVVGLNFDFLTFNMTKHTSYLIFNAALYFSSEVQRQYHEKYGKQEVCSGPSPKNALTACMRVHDWLHGSIYRFTSSRFT